MLSFKRMLSVSIAGVGSSLLLYGAAVAGANPMTQSASAIALAGPPALSTAGLTHLRKAQLADIRGGFSLPGGVKINFGFALQTFVDGSPVQNITQSVQKLAPAFVSSQKHRSGTAFSADHPGLGHATRTVSEQTTRKARPGGTTFTTTVPGRGHTSTLVQNTLSSSGVLTHINNNVNNRAVQVVRTYNIDITGLKTQIRDSAAISHLTGSLVPR